MEQTEVRKAMTYVESKSGLKQLPINYTEDALHRRFSTMATELSDELAEYSALSEELERTDEETDWNSSDKEKPLLAQKILAERASLKHMRETAQKKYDSAVMYDTWLHEYGNEFAQLYRIKDNHEQRGYDEELEIREIDITDNGDILTNDKYNKMNAYAPEPLTELVLHVKMNENEPEDEENPETFGFNFGVMEFNQPNMPPQVKVQLSFDNETLDNLDEKKLKRIFAFCEAHGISVSDLTIRRFDGSLAEDLIREKIEHILEKAQTDRENKNRLENKKEKAKEDVRMQELENERQKLLLSGKAKEDELSWNEVSADIVPEHRVMKAMVNPAPMAREFAKPIDLPKERANISMPERQSGHNMISATVDTLNIRDISDAIHIMSTGEIPPVQTISKGVASPEVFVPAKEMTREIIETAKETARNIPETSVDTPRAKTQTTGNTPKVVQKSGTQKTPISAPQVQEAPVFKEPTDNAPMRAAQQSVSVPTGGAPQQAGAQVPPPPTMPQHSISKVEKEFEKMFEKDWGKVKNLSYFKTHTGWFKNGWTVYTFYDTEDKNNRKNDGIKQKDGSVKYTYSYKLFMRIEKDGVHFSYRTPNHRKIDETVIADMVGKLQGLGYTHINFPAGITNAEKGMWRKAMAENGIVPVNLKLNVKHVRAMIDDMKKTEKYTPQEISEYGYKLAQEMKRMDAAGGKTPNVTRKAFIDGLINTHRYFAFTNAYSENLKGKIEKMLRKQNTQTGAPEKFAAYLTLRKVFDVYTEALEHGNSLLQVPSLTASERQQLSRLGLGGSVQKLRPEQLEQVFDVLYPHVYKLEYDKFKNLLWEKSYASAAEYGPRLAPNVVFGNELDFVRGEAKGIASELKKLGIEDFTPFEDTKMRFEFDQFTRVDLPEYRRLNPPQNQNGNTPATNTPNTNAPATNAPNTNAPTTNAPTRQTAQKVNLNTAQYADKRQKKTIVRRIKINSNDDNAPVKQAKEVELPRSNIQQSAQSASLQEQATTVNMQKETQSQVDVSKVVANSKTGNAL